MYTASVLFLIAMSTVFIPLEKFPAFLFVPIYLPAADAFVSASLLFNEPGDILRRIPQKQSNLMRKISAFPNS